MFLIIAVASLLSLVDAGGASEFFYTGKGRPYNWKSNNIDAYWDISLEACKENCDKQKDCASIFHSLTNGICNTVKIGANVFSLIHPDGAQAWRTYSKAKNLEKFVDNTCAKKEKKLLKYCTESVKTLKEYVASEKKYLG